MSEPIPKKRRRNQQTHLAIMQAAATLVEERGYSKVSIEAIAKHAGAGKQTIYRWWTNKAYLFLEVYLSLVSEEKLSVDTGDVSDDLETLLNTLFGIYQETPAALILTGLVQEAQTDEKIRQHIVDMLISKRRGVVGGVFERAIARQEIHPDTNINLVVDMISGAIWLRLFLRHEPLDRTFAQQLSQQVIAGIRL